MRKLGRIGRRRDSRQRWRKPQMSKEGDLTEGDGRGEEGNTLMHRMYIHKFIKVNYYAEHEKEGRGRVWEWELGEG